MRFRPCQHVRLARDFERLKASGKRVNCGVFVILWQIRPEGGGLPRLGVVASGKVGNAVIRNRVKRLFREIFRLNQQKLPCDCDLLMIARSGVLEQPYKALEERFLKACERICKEAEPLNDEPKEEPL